MKLFVIVVLLLGITVYSGCSAGHNLSNIEAITNEQPATNLTSNVDLDEGMNINITPIYRHSDDYHPIDNDSIGESYILFPALYDTTPQNLVDEYAHEFYEWEERVGMEEMLFWKKYPDWYGGFYIDDGKMIFMLTSEEGVETLPKGAIWKICKYSHNVLERIKEKISDEIYNHLDIFESAGIRIDDRHNCVVVIIRNNSPEALNFFKENIYDGEEVIIPY